MRDDRACRSNGCEQGSVYRQAAEVRVHHSFRWHNSYCLVKKIEGYKRAALKRAARAPFMYKPSAIIEYSKAEYSNKVNRVRLTRVESDSAPSELSGTERKLERFRRCWSMNDDIHSLSPPSLARMQGIVARPHSSQTRAIDTNTSISKLLCYYYSDFGLLTVRSTIFFNTVCRCLHLPECKQNLHAYTEKGQTGKQGSYIKQGC
jgi:hypothetical protein